MSKVRHGHFVLFFKMLVSLSIDQYQSSFSLSIFEDFVAQVDKGLFSKVMFKP